MYFFRSDISWSVREISKVKKKGILSVKEMATRTTRTFRIEEKTRRVSWMNGTHSDNKQYLELDVVYRRGGDHAVERSKAMLIANLFAVQLKLRLTHFTVHIQSYHSLMRDAEKTKHTSV